MAVDYKKYVTSGAGMNGDPGEGYARLDNGDLFNYSGFNSEYGSPLVENRGSQSTPNFVLNGSGVGNASGQLYSALDKHLASQTTAPAPSPTTAAAPPPSSNPVTNATKTAATTITPPPIVQPMPTSAPNPTAVAPTPAPVKALADTTPPPKVTTDPPISTGGEIFDPNKTKNPTLTTVGNYDPRNGPPSWTDPRYGGPGTAKDQEEFQKQVDIYKQYLQLAGVAQDIGGGTLTNTQASSGTQHPTFAPVDIGGLTPPAEQPGSFSSGAGAAGAAGPGGDGKTWGNGWHDGTPEGEAAWIAAGRPDINGVPRDASYYGPTGNGMGGTYGDPGTTPYTPPPVQGDPIDRSGLSGQVPTVGQRTYVPDLSAINPNNSLRSQQINPNNSAALNGINATTAQAAQNLAGRMLPAFQPVTATDSGASQRLGNEAAGLAQGAKLGEFAPISPTQLDQAMAAVKAAQGQTAQATGAQKQSIAPTDTTSAQNTLNQANQQIGQAQGSTSFQGIDAGTYSTSPAAQRARDIATQDLEGLNSSPDRLQLALNAYDRFRQQQDPQFQQDLRAVGQKAAAFGRVGAGMTTNELTDLSTQRNRDEALQRSALIDNAVSQSLADRQSNLSATLAAGGQFNAEDLNTAGFQQGLRGEARDERGAVANNTLANAQLALQRAGALQSTASQQTGLAQIARGDQESDRNYGTSTDLANSNLALSRAGQLEGQGQTLANLAGVTRADQESDRNFGASQSAANAQLALQKSGALQGLSNDRYAQESGLRNEQRTERSDQLSQALQQAGLDQSSLNSLLATGSQFFGQEQGQRNELRDERSFQDQLAKQAVQDRINQSLMQEQFTDSDFQRQLDRARLLRDIANIGYGGGTSEVLLRAAGN